MEFRLSVDLCEPQFCDITFLVENRLVRFNRFLLEFHAPTFAALFSDRWTQGKSPTDPIASEMTFDDMRTFFKVLTANGHQSISFDNVRQLLQLGDMYQIALVTAHCEKFLLGNLSSGRFVFICELAATFDLHDLLRLVSRASILEDFYGYPNHDLLPLLAVCGKWKQKLGSIFSYIETQMIQHTSQSFLLWLIAGYEAGSQRLIDTYLPLAAQKVPRAYLLAARSKLSEGLHCELMLQSYACAQGSKPAASKRRRVSVS